MAFRKDNNTNKPKSFTKIAIGLASPEEILELAKERGEMPFIIICAEIEDPHN